MHQLFTAAASAAILSSCASASAKDEWSITAGEYLVEGLLDANGVPGMSFAVEVDGEQQWNIGIGLRDIEANVPVTTETQFRFASVSKTFAATAAAKLYEEGMLDIDAPVTDYVPDYPPTGRDMTARQLAAHMSGIPHYQAEDAGRGIVHFDSVADALDIFKDRALLFPPGEGYNYSSYGYTLLSAVIEGASGKQYLDYVHDVLLAPAGVDEIGPEDVTVENSALTKMYEVSGGGAYELSAHDYSYSWGGAGMRGTASDLAAFGSAVFNGELIARDTLEFVLTPTLTAAGETVGRYDYRVGFGWRIGADYAGRRIAHHAGVTPGARSVALIYPDDGASVAVLSNARWTSQIERTAYMIASLFLSGSPIQSPGACPAGAKFFSGVFDGAETSGSVRLDYIDGVCRGVLTLSGAFADYLGEYAPNGGRDFRVVALERREDKMILAVATPLGVIDVTYDEKEEKLSTVIGSSRRFEAQVQVLTSP